MLYSILYLISLKNLNSDLYPTRIGFTYNGKSEVKSLFGGIVSTIIRAIVFLIALMLTITIFQRGNITTSINTIFKDLTNDSVKHYIARDGIYFAFRLNGPYPEKLLDPTYFKFEILQSSYIKETNSVGYSATTTPIEYEYWGNKFPFVQKQIYDRLGLSSYIWPKNTDFFLRANFNSDNYEIIQIFLTKWTGSNWKGDTEINEILNTHYIDIEITSAYFDF